MPAELNQAINNSGMEAGCILDLPTSCVMGPAGFRCGIMRRKVKFAKLYVSWFRFVLYYLTWINGWNVFLLGSDLDIASDLELALRQARNCCLFLLKILDCGNTVEQQGASEVCWPHNPEVARLKLPPSNNFLAKFFREYIKLVETD